MDKSIVALREELARVRAGRASPDLLDSLRVDYYGQETPLNQVASVIVENALMLVVKPWEKNMVGPIEKAILTSDLGLNPANSGDQIRVPLPPLSEERRKELTKKVRHEGEQAKVAVRNIRRDANTQVKQLLKDKAISEDDERRSEERIQKLTDQFVKKVDEILAEKEKDLLAM